jgi:hypothetical protein
MRAAPPQEFHKEEKKRNFKTLQPQFWWLYF